jgi:hypothetical protein
MKRLIAGLVLLLLAASSGYAETIVFEGSPQMANYSSPEETFNMTLTVRDQTNYRCVIIKEGGKYFWLSREMKPLNHVKSGMFDYFVNPDGDGYIKIAKMKDGTYAYMETMNVTFRVVTYWGIVDKFEP